jgi:hypothetical protein
MACAGFPPWFRRNGFCDDTSGSDYRSAADGYVRQYYHPYPKHSIFFDYHTFLFAVVGNDGDPDPNCCTVPNSDEMWAGRFNDRVVPDPHILADVNASPPVEQHARSCGARCNLSEHLKNPIFKPGSRRSDIRSLFLQNDISSPSPDIIPIKKVCSLRRARWISDERNNTPLVLKNLTYEEDLPVLGLFTQRLLDRTPALSIRKRGG